MLRRRGPEGLPELVLVHHEHRARHTFLRPKLLLPPVAERTRVVACAGGPDVHHLRLLHAGVQRLRPHAGMSRLGTAAGGRQPSLLPLTPPGPNVGLGSADPGNIDALNMKIALNVDHRLSITNPTIEV